MKHRVFEKPDSSKFAAIRSIRQIQAKFILILLFYAIMLSCASAEAQNKVTLINQYNEQLLAGDFAQAHKIIKRLIAAEPDNFDFQREHIKVLGALNEKDAFMKEMLALRQNGSPVAIQNFYSIIDANEVSQELKQDLKTYFEQENDSFILKKWEKSVRDQPLIKIGTPTAAPTSGQQVASQSQEAAAQPTPAQPDTKFMTEEEKREFEIEQKQLEQRMKEDAIKIAPEDDPGFTRH